LKTARFSSIGGASGDMILASLIDLGADVSSLRDTLATLKIETFDIEAIPVTRDGCRGIQVTVHVAEGEHPHRNLNDIRALITESALPPAVKEMSVLVFTRLAKAEAAVHGTSPQEIHFHEVGAVDAIVDVVGSCAALSMLGVEAVSVDPLPLGTGLVECEHGTLPVPVPATLELLKGQPVERTEEPFELVTPTGAALLTTWQTNLARAEEGVTCVIRETGVGFGHRTLRQRSNLLRAMLMEDAEASPGTCVALECNLDDTIPELLGSLTQKLLDSGALDVFTTPIQMKKQRPGALLTTLCRCEDKDRFMDMIFEESTTFGIRERRVRRTVLERRHITVETPYGQVRVKIGSWRGKDITRAPEHGDCVRCAEERSVPVRKVYESALRAT